MRNDGITVYDCGTCVQASRLRQESVVTVSRDAPPDRGYTGTQSVLKMLMKTNLKVRSPWSTKPRKK